MTTIHDLERHGVIAVIRAESSRQAVAVATELVGAGLKAIELTTTTPGYLDAVRELAAETDALLGVGTITVPAQADAAAGRGAQFLVSPGSTHQLLEAMRQTELTFLPGVMTPTEVIRAAEHGAAGVKLFPAAILGPTYLRALKAPFPSLKVIPTGGVSAANARAWFEAGASAIGVGGALAPARVSDFDTRAQIRIAAIELLALIHKVRSNPHPTHERITP